MNLITRLRYRLAAGLVKGMAWPLVPQWARHSFMVPTFRALVREGYGANSAVYGCISALAFAFHEPPLRLYQEDDSGLRPLPDHPLEALLARPNPDMGLAELLVYTMVYMAVGGNCYWYKVRGRGNRVVQLWPLHDGTLRPVGGGERLVGHYEWDRGEGQPEIIPTADVVHLKWMPDPLAPWRGMAPLKAVAREIDTDNEATAYIFALLKNDAIPRTVIQAPTGAALSDDEVKRMRRQWRDLYGGEKRGDVAILEGGATVERLSLDMQELAAEALRRVPEARICAALRTPPIVAGLNVGLERSTYSNFEEAVRSFTLRTLVPLWRLVEDEITADLLPDFRATPQLRVKFDLSSVQVMEEIHAQEWGRVNEAVKAGWLLVNEARARVGYPSLGPAGDVFLRSPLLSPTPALLPPPAGPEPQPEEEEEVIQGEGGAQGQGGVRTLASGRESKDPEEDPARESAKRVIVVLQQARNLVAGNMESATDNWFARLAEVVVGRARAWGEAGAPDPPETKQLPPAGDLLQPADWQEFVEEVVKRHLVELTQLSWETLNQSLGVDVAFELGDPTITAVLADAGTRIKRIHETTLAALRQVLQHGGRQGWGVDELVRGDPRNGIPGLRQVIQQTYRDRARTVARTELGTAQNQVTAHRIANAGVDNTLILDDGLADSCPECIILGQGGQGTVVPTAWFLAHPLAHPNCVRAGAPYNGPDPAEMGVLQDWADAGGDAFTGSDIPTELQRPQTGPVALEVFREAIGQEPTERQPIGEGVFGAHRVTYPDGTSACVKSAVGSDPTTRRLAARAAQYHPGMDMADSEVIAHRVSQALGMDLVPPTEYTLVGGAKASAQQWVEGSVVGQDVCPASAAQIAAGRLPPFSGAVLVDEARLTPQRSLMELFDLVIGNPDRHWGNWVWDPEGEKLWAVDHGLADFEPATPRSVAQGAAPFLVPYLDRMGAMTPDDWKKVLRGVQGPVDSIAQALHQRCQGLAKRP